MVGRVGLSNQTEHEKLGLVSDLLALCESGWDFTPRCESSSGPFSAHEYAFLDLNCLLYDAQVKASEMLSVIGDKEKAEKYSDRANKCKTLILELMRDKQTGVFYDYNFKEEKLSPVLSAVSFMPFAMGISSDRSAIIKTLEKLEFEHGISACEYRKDKVQLQWDYPMMWPSNVYFAVEGLNALGLTADAKRVADKYTEVLERVYAETGKLWEKYNSVTGLVATTPEYETPAMMGWTAGVYKHLKTNY
jgi:alpha,alpha-trehalase